MAFAVNAISKPLVFKVAAFSTDELKPEEGETGKLGTITSRVCDL